MDCVTSRLIAMTVAASFVMPWAAWLGDRQSGRIAEAWVHHYREKDESRNRLNLYGRGNGTPEGRP